MEKYSQYRDRGTIAQQSDASSRSSILIRCRIRYRTIFPNTHTTLGPLSAILPFPIPLPDTDLAYSDSELFYRSAVVAHRVSGEESVTLADLRDAGHLVD